MPPLFCTLKPLIQMKQQRTSQRRRNKPNPGGAQLPTIDWEVAIVSPSVTRITPVTLNTGAPTGIERWRIPPNALFSIRGSAATILTTTPTTNAIDLQWSDPIAPTDVIIRQPGLSDIRGPTGEYLTGKSQPVPGAGPAPEDIVINTAYVDGGDLVITWTPGPQFLGLGNSLTAALLDGGNQITVIQTALGSARLTWASPISVGQQLDTYNTAGYWNNSSGGGLTPTTMIIS